MKRSGLVGIPFDGSEIPVICAELVAGTPASEHAAIRRELLAMAVRQPATRQIAHVLFPAVLPVDPRHNSKIERPALAKWAAAQLKTAARRNAAGAPR